VQPRRGADGVLQRLERRVRLPRGHLRPPESRQQIRLSRRAAERSAQLVDRLVGAAGVEQRLRQRQAVVHVVRPRGRRFAVGLDGPVPIAEEPPAGADLRQDEPAQRVGPLGLRSGRHGGGRSLRGVAVRAGSVRPGAGRRRSVRLRSGRDHHRFFGRPQRAERGLVQRQRRAHLPLQPQRSALEREQADRHRPIRAARQHHPQVFEGPPGARRLAPAQGGEGILEERRAPRRDVARGIGGRKPSARNGGPAVEPLGPQPLHLGDPLVLHRSQVARLAGIAAQVVQLERAAADELEAGGAHRHAPRSAEPVRRQDRLGSRRQRRQGPLRVEQRREARPLHRPRRRELQEIQQSRGQVEQADRLRDGAIAHREPGHAQQHRHAQRGVVQADAASRFAVLAEPRAVARDHGDDGAPVHAERREPLKKAPDAGIGALDLGVVRLAMPQGAGRIGRMRRRRIGELHPQEEAGAEVIVEPGARRVEDVVGRPLGEPAHRRRPFACARLVEPIEAARQSAGPADRRRAHECGGLVTGSAQDLGERRGLGRKGRARPQQGGAADGRGAGHQGAVRRESLRHRGRRLLEAEALRRQPVEVRRRRQGRVAIRAEAVDPQAVDADEDEAGVLRDVAALDTPGALQRRALERRQPPGEGPEQGRDREEREPAEQERGAGARHGAHRSA